jgi:hypothetical protein
LLQSNVQRQCRSVSLTAVSQPRPKAIILLKERLLNFIMDAPQPFFRARGPIAKMCGLCLELACPLRIPHGHNAYRLELDGPSMRMLKANEQTRSEAPTDAARSGSAPVRKSGKGG